MSTINANPVPLPGVFPAPPGVTPNYVNPEHNDVGVVPLVAILTPLSTIFLALRLYTKARIVQALGWEDGVITVAWLCTIALSGIFVRIYEIGGIHLWDLTVFNIGEYLKLIVADGVLYPAAVTLPKVAILAFYLRINPERRFRICTAAVIVFALLEMTILMCLSLFACRPVRKLWNPTLPGHCFPTNPVYLATTIINTVVDVIVIALPIPMLVKLQVNKRTKVALAAIFAVSSAAVVFSILRIWSIDKFQSSYDLSWNTMLSVAFAIIETNLSVMCGSIVMLRPFCRRHLPFLLGSSGRSDAEEHRLHVDGPYGPNSKSDYQTKISSGGRSSLSQKKPGKRSWWKSLGGTMVTKDDDEDLENLSTELARVGGKGAQGTDIPTARDHRVGRAGEALAPERKRWHGHGATHSANTTKSEIPDQYAIQGEGNGIVKTMSLDIS